MRQFVKWAVAGMFVALLAVATAPALQAEGIELAGFYSMEPLLVGGTTLEPGVYLIRVLHLEADRNVLVLTNAESMKVVGLAIASPYDIPKEQFTTTGKLVYEHRGDTHTNILRRWVVANASVGFNIAPFKSPTELASSDLRTITMVAVAR